MAQTTINTGSLTGFGISAIQATDTAGSSTSEVQTVTLNNASGGTFRLNFGSEQTADIAYNASAGTVETALEALAGIDNVTVSGSAGGPYTITFDGTQAGTNVSQITADATFLTSGSVNRTLSYSYDAASQLTAAEDSDSEYAYTYDNLGRVLTVSNSGTSGVPTVVLTSAYNANSQRTSLSATRGGTNDFLNSYTYDNLNRLTRVDQTGNGGHTVANKRVDFEYNAVGQFTEITRQVKPSSTWNEVATSTFTYDTRSRLTALDHKIGSTDIANYDWTYDAMDRVTQLSNGDGTSDYTYDKESEVTATDHSFQTDESYTYDATGNRTNGSYSVGSNNRMTSDGTYNYTYDDEGNRLTRTKISDNSLTEYTWDHRNRLTKVVERAAGAGQPITKQTDYKYDVFDRRISKSVDADGAGGGSAVVSRFVYDSDNIALQFDGASALTHRYLYGPAVDQILADEDASNNILWPLTDNLGTVRDLVNSSGTVQNHLKYDAFGRVTSESNSAVDHLFAYTGRERDEETGLQYSRKRYYDSATGRFLSYDPIGFGSNDPNLSRYVGNNSTNRVDPFGLDDGPLAWAYIAVEDGEDAAATYADWFAANYKFGGAAPIWRWADWSMSMPTMSGYWHYLTNPSEMDPHLKIAFNTSVTTAVVAGTAAGAITAAPVLGSAVYTTSPLTIPTGFTMSGGAVAITTTTLPSVAITGAQCVGIVGVAALATLTFSQALRDEATRLARDILIRDAAINVGERMQQHLVEEELYGAADSLGEQIELARQELAILREQLQRILEQLGI